MPSATLCPAVLVGHFLVRQRIGTIWFVMVIRMTLQIDQQPI
jgi:hypothetical protein